MSTHSERYRSRIAVQRRRVRRKVDPVVREHKAMERYRLEGSLLVNRPWPGAAMRFAPHGSYARGGVPS